MPSAPTLRKRAEHLWRGLIAHSTNAAAASPAAPPAAAAAPAAPAAPCDSAMSANAADSAPALPSAAPASGGGGGGGGGGDGAAADARGGDEAVLEGLRADRKPKPAAEEEHPFFHYYGMLVHQQNMLQDAVRTGTYHDAIISNPHDFKDKVVMDVGTGSGILAFFAANAGAKTVYAVEASGMAEHAKTLVKRNGYQKFIDVIEGKVEDIEIPEEVDVLISEPMGFLLVHERMLESYIAARDRFMKRGGKMFPGHSTIYVSPFSDDALYQEQMGKVAFWKTTNFYGVDLSSLEGQAKKDHFAQPVVGYFPASILIADEYATRDFDFHTCSKEDLTDFSIPFSFCITRTSIMHGFACWFDVEFRGTEKVVRLCTGPMSPGTHWYQCRLLLGTPIAVNPSQIISGTMSLKANKAKSYDVDIVATLDGTRISATAAINLQDQYYHYLSSSGSATDYGSDQAGGQQQAW